MERKRSSQSTGTPSISESSPLIPSHGDDTVNIGVGLQTPDPETSDPSGGTQQPSFSFRSLSTDKKCTLVTMAFANFTACTCFSLLAPFFPQEASLKGASQTVVGLIFSCFELVIFLSAPIYGNFLTRIGSRFLFISGLFVCGMCAILFGTLDKCPPGTIFIVMCFLVRAVEALGASAFITASFAIIANEFPSHVSTVFGVLETFSGLGLMVGPPIGGLLYELGGFGIPFWVMGSLLIGCAGLTSTLLPSRPDKPRPDRSSMWWLLTSPLVFVTTLTIISGAYSLGFLDPTLAGHLQQFHLKTVYVGLVFVVPSAIYAVTAPLFGYLSDSKGISLPLIAVGNTVSIVAFLLLGPSSFLTFLKPELWLVILSLSIGGVSIGCALVCTLKCLIDGAKEKGFEDNLDTYGLVSGLFNSAFSLGTFIGPTVGSTIQEYYGFECSSTITAGVFAFSAVTFISFIVFKRVCHGSCFGSQQDPVLRGGASQGPLSQTPSVGYSSFSGTPRTVPSSNSSIAQDNA